MQGGRSEGKIKTEKDDEGCYPADILTKPLQGKEFKFKRGRLLGHRARPGRPRGRALTRTPRRAPAGLRTRLAVPAARPPTQLPGHGAERSGCCSGGGAARPGPGKDHRIAHVSSLLIDPCAMGGKKRESFPGPTCARGALEPRGRRRQLIRRYNDVAESSRDQSTRLYSLCLMSARLYQLYLIEPGRSRRSNERETITKRYPRPAKGPAALALVSYGIVLVRVRVRTG